MMNIQNIQIAQGLFRTLEGKLTSRKANIAAQSDAPAPQINVPDTQDRTVDNPNVSNEKDLMKVVYPPFFPVGNTQDILAIKRVNLTGEASQSMSSATVEEQKAIRQKDIDNKATNADASAVRHDKTESTDAPLKAKTPQVKPKANPGVVLDLKV